MRQAIAAYLEQELDGWRESRLAGDLFPDLGTRNDLHRRFSVDLPSSDALDGRQRGEMGATTEVRVRYALTMKADSQRDAYDAALDEEEALLTALAALKTAACPVALRIVEIGRAVGPDGNVFVGEISCTVPHRIPLS